VLLAPEPWIARARLDVTSKRIDINAAPPLVARVHAQFFRAASLADVDKDAFDTGFVEVVVFPE
jgi:hypothetical protein